jgi:hypothetical protein
MQKVALLLSLGTLFSMAAFAETWSGTISDSMCGAKHETATAADMACVKKCVKAGASAVFVSDGKVYQISPDSQGKAKALLGEKVTVNGKVEGDTIDIASIQAAR